MNCGGKCDSNVLDSLGGVLRSKLEEKPHLVARVFIGKDDDRMGFLVSFLFYSRGCG
jgi:hypothetical protein